MSTSNRFDALLFFFVALFFAASLSGCSGTVPMQTAKNVDLPRFMGDWYVLAHIPTSQERDAWNAVESYRLRKGSTDVVDVSFVFRRGAYDGPLETMRPTGYVSDDPAAWGMKFFWWQGPIRFEYLIVDLDSDYQVTVIGRSARDYVWVMARTPTLPDSEWTRIHEIVRAAGYDPAKLRRVPQRWGEQPDLSPGDRH